MRCDTQRDVYVIERFGGLDMSKARHKGWPLPRAAQLADKRFGGEKNMRNGRYAFPQLRNFHNLRALKGETLFDNFISVLSANHKHLWCNYKDRTNRQRLKSISQKLMGADRFVITGDLQKKIADISFEANDEKIFDVFNNAIPPFDNMWIETEKNPLPFTIEGGGDGYYEQVAWHIQRGGAYSLNQYGVTEEELAELQNRESIEWISRKESKAKYTGKASDNIIVITKFIKFSKAHDNPDKLFKDADLSFKMDKLPHDGGGCYYISDLSILVSDRPIPSSYTSSLFTLALHGNEHVHASKFNINTSDERAAKDVADNFYPLLSFGDKWTNELLHGQPHIYKNIARRVSITESYGMDLSHWLIHGADVTSTTHALDHKRVTDFCSTSFGHYDDDLRILAWALSDFNYNWIFKKPATKPTRRNRSKPFRQATIETRTLEIELPKPRGKEMDEHQFGDGTPRKWHKVRGHWRKYKKTGYRVWIVNYERGDKKLGEVHKDYKLKHKK